MNRLRLVVPRYPYFNVYSRIPMPPLGLVSVGTAVVRTGRWEVEIVDENNYRGDLDHGVLQQERPADVVGFYAGLTSTAPRVYEVARWYRGQGVPTLAGGAHVGALPDEALAQGIDIVVLGEGEESAVEVLDALSAGRSLASIPGLVYREGDALRRTAPRAPIADLDALPTPDFSLLVNMRQRLRFAPISRTRGCNFRCEFCAVHSQLGPTRWASPERTFDQIRELSRQGHQRFFFTDDNFAQDRAGTVSFLRRVIAWRETLPNRRRPHFFIQARAEIGRDGELLRLMRRARVTTICIGLESPLDEDLRAMHKGQSAATMESDLLNLRRHGFYIHGMFIFGYPRAGRTRNSRTMSAREQADRYLAFIRRVHLDTIQVMKPVPLPGTGLAERLAREGRLYPLSEVGWEKHDGNWVLFEPDPGTPAVELQEEATRIMREFYRPRNLAKWMYLAPISPLDAAYVTLRKARELWRAHLAEWHRVHPGQHRVAHARQAIRRIIRDSILAGWAAVKRRWRNAIWRTGAVFVIKQWLQSAKRERFRELLLRRPRRGRASPGSTTGR